MEDLGKIVRVTVLRHVPLYYMYYTLRFVGSRSNPYVVRTQIVYDAFFCTAPVPSVLLLGPSAI